MNVRLVELILQNALALKASMTVKIEPANSVPNSVKLANKILRIV
jgi:hypothetical protein